MEKKQQTENLRGHCILWHSFIRPHHHHSFSQVLPKWPQSAPWGGLKDDWLLILSAKTSSTEKTGATPDFLYKQSLEVAICWKWTHGNVLWSWLRIRKAYFHLDYVFMWGDLGRGGWSYPLAQSLAREDQVCVEGPAIQLTRGKGWQWDLDRIWRVQKRARWAITGWVN